MEVLTRQGVVEGDLWDGIARFLGIPYARAPRFGAPAPPEPWSGVRPAHAFGPTQPRVTTGFCDLMLGGSPELIGPDGWLTVNVWAPLTEGPHPVMVWIHGGSYLRGSSAGTAYDGTAFARDGVVLVSLNYRLGLDGFGHLPGTPANRGLLDQIAALEWVRDNVERFGGDPGDVTVFGESAGAMSILALLSMRPDLFARAVVQSGAVIGQTPDDAERVVRELAGRLGVEPTAEALAEVPFDRLVAAQQAVHSDVLRTADRKRFGDSTIDSCCLSFMPVLEPGPMARVPLLIGTTTDEYRFFVRQNPFLAKTDAKTRFDRLFRGSSLEVAEELGAYAYEFTAGPTVDDLGACHLVEIPFVWDTLTAPGVDELLVDPSQDLADAVHARWVEFARTGELADWPKYDETRPVMRFHAGGSGITRR